MKRYSPCLLRLAGPGFMGYSRPTMQARAAILSIEAIAPRDALALGLLLLLRPARR